jgi:hypothetical protein
MINLCVLFLLVVSFFVMCSCCLWLPFCCSLFMLVDTPLLCFVGVRSMSLTYELVSVSESSELPWTTRNIFGMFFLCKQNFHPHGWYNFATRITYFIHLHKIFFLEHEIFCPCGWKNHHIVGEKRAGSGHKFGIFRNVELIKEIKWHPLKTLWNCWRTQW